MACAWTSRTESARRRTNEILTATQPVAQQIIDPILGILRVDIPGEIGRQKTTRSLGILADEPFGQVSAFQPILEVVVKRHMRGKTVVFDPTHGGGHRAHDHPVPAVTGRESFIIEEQGRS